MTLEKDNLKLIVENCCTAPFNFKDLFPKYDKVDVEIGFSSGFFLSEYASKHPETAFLGVEIKRAYYEKGIANLSRLLTRDGVKCICFEAMSVVTELIPFESVDSFHIYFPDPWPKKRHNKNRIIKLSNLMILCNRLKKGGRIYIATDHPDYAKWIKDEILGTLSVFNTLPYDKSMRDVKTKWEKRQIAAGWNINYFLLEKK